jgi:hypothetical protein
VSIKAAGAFRNVAAVIGFAAAGILVAVLASEGGCGSTDGSFLIDDPRADPSGYCDATHFPGFPDSLGSALLVGAIYLSPAVAMAAGILFSEAMGTESSRRLGRGLAIALLVLAVVITLGGANIDYRPAP